MPAPRLTFSPVISTKPLFTSRLRLKTPTEDPFCDLDSEDEENEHDSELEELLLQANNPDCCSVENFISADNDIPTCVDLDNVNWEQDFLSELCQVQVKMMMMMTTTNHLK